ncbi:CHAT domain-containing protein [Streptomyces sp. NPDC020965]|uniref:CHAT domain-containing protein n=1 Tax=Streptomyces sp. NPDC020965 TaxID=3365105 RepID=UPI0037B18488
MPRELPARILQDPSLGFTRLPRRGAVAPDLVVVFDRYGDDRVQARMYGTALPAIGSEHRVLLDRRPTEIQGVSSRLRRLWKREFVEFQPLEEGYEPPGRIRPYASLIDLRDEPERELYDSLEELATQGSHLLFELLLAGEPETPVGLFRAFLMDALAGERPLRIRFDSDLLYVPWAMLALPAGAVPGPSGLDGLFPRFLGYRHQIEQTCGYHGVLPGPAPRRPPELPVVSLNHDTGIDRQGRTRAHDVADALAKGTVLTERTTRAELLDALERGRLDEQLMYFWCHGNFRTDDGQSPCLVVRLSDGREIDAYTLRGRRPTPGTADPFQPLVMLNACFAAQPSGADLAYLGQALMDRGARGIIGPQIEMPQIFAAEYALGFVTRYLDGRETAGEIAHALARHFADSFRNPLGFAYGLHGGMDERLERAS